MMVKVTELPKVWFRTAINSSFELENCLLHNWWKDIEEDYYKDSKEKKKYAFIPETRQISLYIEIACN